MSESSPSSHEEPVEGRPPEPAQAGADARLRALLARWGTRRRQAFAADFVDALEDAERRAQQRSGQGGPVCITAQDLAASLDAIGQRSDTAGPVFPVAVPVSQGRDDSQQVDVVDGHGSVDLSDLDTCAKAIVETAHSLAEERGLCPIPNRVMLAALLADSDGYGSRVFRAAGRDPGLTALLMVTLSEGKAPRSFDLDGEACKRIVWPVLTAARAAAGPGQRITEQHLFEAFCTEADPGFKSMLASALSVDLDHMAGLGPTGDAGPRGGAAPCEGIPGQAGVEDTARRAVAAAAEVAGRLQWPLIRTPHLFCGMVGDGNTVAGDFLRKHHLDVERVKQAVLSLLPAPPSSGPVGGQVGLSDNVRTMLGDAIKLAKGRDDPHVTGQDLFDAFFADGGSVVGDMLRQAGIPVPRGKPRSR